MGLTAKIRHRRRRREGLRALKGLPVTKKKGRGHGQHLAPPERAAAPVAAPVAAPGPLLTETSEDPTVIDKTVTATPAPKKRGPLARLFNKKG